MASVRFHRHSLISWRRRRSTGDWRRWVGGINKITSAVIFIYYASASSLDKKEELKKTIFVKTITTKPPIVWFPGDPDCGEGDLGGNSKLDTFQLIAFLLSAFNIAAIMASNVNNNNNNNNINDNEGNYNL